MSNSLNENLGGLGLPAAVRGVEVFGFLGFLAGLGYVAAQRVFGNERRLANLAQELETARRIQASILPRALPSVAGLRVAVRYQPMTAVARDFWDFLAADGRVGLLLADVSGLGVPATQPAEVVAGMNAALRRVLDGPFVTAIYASLSPGQGRLGFAGAEHPPALLWRAGSRSVELLSENGLLMGFDGAARYEVGEVPLGPAAPARCATTRPPSRWSSTAGRGSASGAGGWRAPASPAAASGSRPGSRPSPGG